MKKHEYTEDGRLWFDDHICEMADLILGTEGIRYIYLKKHDRTWIRRIGDDSFRFTVTDIRRILDLTMTEFRIEIREMRKALLAAM